MAQKTKGVLVWWCWYGSDILLRVPGKMTFEEAARFGTGVATASMSLFDELHVLVSLQLLCGQSGEN